MARISVLMVLSVIAVASASPMPPNMRDGQQQGLQPTDVPPSLVAATTLPSSSATISAAAPVDTSAPADASSDFQALYEAAQAEGGQLVLKLGGDETFQQDTTIANFKAAYPAINVTWAVDLSKFHNVQIDENLKTTGKAGTDVAILQTLQDFDEWKAAGELLAFKPSGFDQIPEHAKDAEGMWYGVRYIAFGPVSSAAAFPNGTGAPIEFEDFSDPALKGKISLTYPNDDDAVLYQFKLLEEQFGEAKLTEFMTSMDIRWVRGSATPSELFNDGVITTTFTSGGVTIANIPTTTNSIVWPQTGAIFKSAEHPEAAKLFMSYMLSPAAQAATGKWSIREDLPLPAGAKPLAEYKNLDATAFRTFMRDQAAVDVYRNKIAAIIGEPVGESPLTDNIGRNGTIKA